MRVTLSACLAIAWFAGGAFSAILPRGWPTNDHGLGREALLTPRVHDPTLRMTKAAFAPFQNFTGSTQAVTSTLPFTASILDETTFLTTSAAPSTSTISLVENCYVIADKVVTGSETITPIFKTPMASEPSCSVANTVTVTITEILSRTMESFTPASSTTKQPTLTTPTASEPSPTVGSIISIPSSIKAQVTKSATAFHSIGLGSGGWNASTFVTTLTGEAVKAGMAGYEMQHVTTKSSTLSKQSQVHERWIRDTVTATINGKVVSWKNERNGEQLSSLVSTKSTAPIQTSGTLTSKVTAGATPTSCGETGFFKISFDDLPVYSPGKNQTAAFPPIFSPYHHFFFSSGWSYGPPSAGPFAPVSYPHIGIHVPTKRNGGKTQSKGIFGGGSRASQRLFWFDAFSAEVGCDNGNSTHTCELTIQGLKYSAESGTEVRAGITKFAIPPCHESKHCTLTDVLFGDGFNGLSGIEIEAQVAGRAVMWYIDDILLRWHDDTCAAGIKRQRSRF
ncbi:hypothetical protein MGYG_00584 [Nannizzia gypsea CBS 118893]|uniref:DUF7371 domain-containing protein n=1 Tax=Arthroderma gypseum (strain ATCC MYA-4604 / CBS 118893) TaxID=535722 RepID=E5R0I4_ARTGP|nr:hypothetical protein MGYG_00584 [Nannizzia gypsea CBS 118893]EFQ97543.1 hypothetical protein MGYG_00584 [Nannizzia gypsea CBS 118893]